jgi:hypothetical protein
MSMSDLDGYRALQAAIRASDLLPVLRDENVVRALRAAIRADDPTLPVLLDPEVIRAVLGLTLRQFDNLVRGGALNDCVLDFGKRPRRLFRTWEVREYLLSSAPKKPSISAILKRPLFGKGSRRSRKAVPATVAYPEGQTAPTGDLRGLEDRAVISP